MPRCVPSTETCTPLSGWRPDLSTTVPVTVPLCAAIGPARSNAPNNPVSGGNQRSGMKSMFTFLERDRRALNRIGSDKIIYDRTPGGPAAPRFGSKCYEFLSKECAGKTLCRNVQQNQTSYNRDLNRRDQQNRRCGV